MFGEVRYSSDMQEYKCIYEAPSNKIARWIVDQYTCLCGDNIRLISFESRVILLSRSEQAIIDCKERLNLKLADMMKEDEGGDNEDDEDRYDEDDEYDDEDKDDEYGDEDEMSYKMPFHISINQMRLTRRSRFNK